MAGRVPRNDADSGECPNEDEATRSCMERPKAEQCWITVHGRSRRTFVESCGSVEVLTPGNNLRGECSTLHRPSHLPEST